LRRFPVTQWFGAAGRRSVFDDLQLRCDRDGERLCRYSWTRAGVGYDSHVSVSRVDSIAAKVAKGASMASYARSIVNRYPASPAPSNFEACHLKQATAPNVRFSGRDVCTVACDASSTTGASVFLCPVRFTSFDEAGPVSPECTKRCSCARRDSSQSVSRTHAHGIRSTRNTIPTGAAHQRSVRSGTSRSYRGRYFVARSYADCEQGRSGRRGAVVKLANASSTAVVGEVRRLGHDPVPVVSRVDPNRECVQNLRHAGWSLIGGRQ